MQYIPCTRLVRGARQAQEEKEGCTKEKKAKKTSNKDEKENEMKILLLTPFLLGNSAGALGALLPLIIGAVVGLGIVFGIVWGLIKWLS